MWFSMPCLFLAMQEWNLGQHASDTRGVSFEDVAVPEEVCWEEWEGDEDRGRGKQGALWDLIRV